MSYHIVRSGDRYCVAKSGSQKPIKGGCHATRPKAQAHLTALNINVTLREKGIKIPKKKT